MTGVIWACARCGAEPRVTETLYLCRTCFAEQATAREMRAAELFDPRGPQRRRYVMEKFGWAGWSVRLRAPGVSTASRSGAHSSGAVAATGTARLAAR